ncbi:MAG: neocarzinostatin apoprotein domain-containing protein [Acidimicrobiales bacterium]
MNRRARGCARAVFGTAVVLSLLVSGAHRAGASGSTKPRIHLSQADNLTPGQIIDIKGWGFPRGRFLLGECAPGWTAGHHCDTFSLDFHVTASTKGTFNYPFQVERDILVNSKTVDCVTLPGCDVEVVYFFGPDNTDKTATQTIFFNPSAKPLVAKMVLSPGTGLAPNQIVTISGVNFAPDLSTGASECLAVADLLFRDCDNVGYGPASTNAAGQLQGSYRVSKYIALYRGHGRQIFNCERTKCEIALVEGGSLGSAPLLFNPKAAPIVPGLTLSASSHLADGEILDVDASGFALDTPVYVQECKLGEPSRCNSEYLGATADVAGSISVQFPVAEDLGALDCNTVTCEILVSDESDTWFESSHRISFDPTAAPVVPVMSVTPSTGIVSGSIVTIAVGNFPVGARVAIEECHSKSHDCFSRVGVMTDATGSAETGLEVTDDSGTCTTAAPCRVLAENNEDPHDTVSEEIAFT